MFEKIKSEIINVSPRQAERFLVLNTYPNQRPLRSGWVSELANFIREGTFLTGNIAISTICFDPSTGEQLKTRKEVMVNGQHQCNSGIVANKTFEANLETFQCNDPEDLSLLYRQFDNNKTRSLQNIVRFEAGALSLKWPAKAASLLVTAAVMKEGMERAHKNRKVELLTKYMKQGDFINQLIFTTSNGGNLKDHAHLMRGPVAQAILYTWDRSQSASLEFWMQVRDGINLKRTMPSYKLRNYLQRYTFARGQGARGISTQMASAHEMTSKCITAWNAYRRGIPTDLKYYSSKPIPKAI
ncbi:MAG TPA: hypothetical protein VMW10_00425 [Alphaproteobacteria bacterium]|nr:hypothetical protein [Alphaproteobacteria bacterium]